MHSLKKKKKQKYQALAQPWQTASIQTPVQNWQQKEPDVFNYHEPICLTDTIKSEDLCSTANTQVRVQHKTHRKKNLFLAPKERFLVFQLLEAKQRCCTSSSRNISGCLQTCSSSPSFPSLSPLQPFYLMYLAEEKPSTHVQQHTNHYVLT